MHSMHIMNMLVWAFFFILGTIFIHSKYMVYMNGPHVMDVRVITIPSRKKWVLDNLYHISTDDLVSINAWNKKGIESKIFPATLKSDDLKAKHNITVDINSGELACYISHLRIYKEIVKKQLDNMLILEDDAKATKWYDSNVIRYNLKELNTLDPEWDILYLGVCWDICSNRTPVNNNFVRTFYPGCTHAYIVSKKGAVALLRHLLPIQNTLDRTIKAAARKSLLRCYATVHNMFVQERIELKSELGHDKEILRMCIDDQLSEPS